MSHFVVFVISETGSEEEVTALLQPYHEFECTGIDDETTRAPPGGTAAIASWAIVISLRSQGASSAAIASRARDRVA